VTTTERLAEKCESSYCWCRQEPAKVPYNSMRWTPKDPIVRFPLEEE